jgi:hypothetical protein
MWEKIPLVRVSFLYSMPDKAQFIVRQNESCQAKMLGC